MGKVVDYSFVYAERCNMCGSPADRHRILGRRLNTRQGLWPKSKVGIATTVMTCTDCGLIYPNPMPIPARIGQHYDVPPESYWNEEYFARDPAYYSGQIRQFEALYGQSAKGGTLTALDVGAGIGKAMIALSAAGFAVYGLEPSEPFYQRAIERMGIDESHLQLAAIEDASFGVNRFDFVNMGAVVEHLYDPSASIKRVMDWLKPSGLVYIEVPSAHYLMSRLARLFYRATGSDYVINTCPMHVPYHLHEFTLRSFQLHAAHNQYSIARHDYYPCESYGPHLFRPLFHSLMALTNTGMQLAIWLKKSSPAA